MQHLHVCTNEKRSFLLLKEIWHIWHQMASALQVLHSSGRTHMELKLEKIMMADHVQQPLNTNLIDSGSACAASVAQSSYVHPMWYNAPETFLGFSFTRAVDMWSLWVPCGLHCGWTVLYPTICGYGLLWQICQMHGPLPEQILIPGLRTSEGATCLETRNIHTFLQTTACSAFWTTLSICSCTAHKITNPK